MAYPLKKDGHPIRKSGNPVRVPNTSGNTSCECCADKCGWLQSNVSGTSASATASGMSGLTDNGWCQQPGGGPGSNCAQSCATTCGSPYSTGTWATPIFYSENADWCEVSWCNAPGGFPGLILVYAKRSHSHSFTYYGPLGNQTTSVSMNAGDWYFHSKNMIMVDWVSCDSPCVQTAINIECEAIGPATVHLVGGLLTASGAATIFPQNHYGCQLTSLTMSIS